MASDYDTDDLKEMPRVAAVIHQLGSPRIVKAFVVYAFSLTALILMLSGREIPDLLQTAVLIFVGVMFEAATVLRRNGKT